MENSFNEEENNLIKRNVKIEVMIARICDKRDIGGTDKGEAK